MPDINLLPVGFYDAYGSKAELSYKLNGKIIDYLLDNDFKLFIPSPVEYEDITTLSSNQKFRVLDPLSDKILTIRSDITTQAIRALSYTKDDYVQICYSGVVLRLNIDQNNHARSLKQAGFEIMTKDLNSEIEKDALQHLLNLMQSINSDSYSIVFSSTLSKSLLREICGFSENDLLEIITKNDLDRVFNNSKIEDLRSILSPKRIDFFTKKQYLNYDSIIVNYFDSISQIAKNLPSILHSRFIFDPLNLKSSNYNSGSFFTIIDKVTGNIIIRGGEYKIKGWGKGYGASFYLEEIIT
ncbi:MAG: hypothetical protein HOM96_01250 [Rickettsiales bacterium]|jgi:ATP phosphoribosyltransferase regulatory subunit HisZ|nr:hypothetical protein [Rickettsiales bacterium]